jgi:hypothetical protein
MTTMKWLHLLKSIYMEEEMGWLRFKEITSCQRLWLPLKHSCNIFCVWFNIRFEWLFDKLWYNLVPLKQVVDFKSSFVKSTTCFSGTKLYQSLSKSHSNLMLNHTQKILQLCLRGSQSLWQEVISLNLNHPISSSIYILFNKCNHFIVVIVIIIAIMEPRNKWDPCAWNPWDVLSSQFSYLNIK